MSKPKPEPLVPIDTNTGQQCGMPVHGGSFIREADGSLTLVERTEDPKPDPQPDPPPASDAPAQEPAP